MILEYFRLFPGKTIGKIFQNMLKTIFGSFWARFAHF